MGDTRIVLVKPGDVLMLGNVTLPEDEDALEAFNTALRTLKENLGLEHILVFEDDIDLAVKPAEHVRHEVHVQQDWSPTGRVLAQTHDAMSRVRRFT